MNLVAAVFYRNVIQTIRIFVYTDIQGLEDHHGDMDLKIAGTYDGITALQLDTKLSGIPTYVLLEALEPSLRARGKILDAMNTVQQRKAAARVGTVDINKDLIVSEFLHGNMYSACAAMSQQKSGATKREK